MACIFKGGCQMPGHIARTDDCDAEIHNGSFKLLKSMVRSGWFYPVGKLTKSLVNGRKFIPGKPDIAWNHRGQNLNIYGEMSNAFGEDNTNRGLLEIQREGFGLVVR